MSPALYVQAMRRRLERGREGQALPLLLVTLLVLLALSFSAVHLATIQAESVRAANVADSAALSAATWEARGLNVIAALNDGVLQCLAVIRYICAVWAGLAVSAAFGVGVPLFTSYSRYARSAIRSYWRLAKRLASWAEKVRGATPYLALEDVLSLSAKHGAVVLLSPANPAGRHDGSGTLELHVAPTREVSLGDAFSPLYRALRKVGKVPGAGSVRRALDGALRLLVAEAGPPLRLLEPEEDLPRRQNVTAAATVRNRAPLPFLSWLLPPSALPAEGTAEAYGGSATEPSWRSRLREKGERT